MNAGKRVLITRPREEGAAFARLLAGHGITGVLEPLLAVRFLPGPPPDLADVQAILATSANGVRAFAARSSCRDVPLFAVGRVTAAAARTAGFAVVVPAGGDVAALAALVHERLRHDAGALLHVAGTEVAGDLAGDLAQAGFTCRRAVLYEAVPASSLSARGREALADDGLLGVALFSPRTAGLFTRLLGEAGLTPAAARLTAFCLSTAVASAAHGLPWRQRVIAGHPDGEGLAAAIVQAARDGSTARK